jgi:hypothetical protein
MGEGKRTMKVAENVYYVMTIEDGVLDFGWLPATEGMDMDAFKDALRVYASKAVKHGIRACRVDLRDFRAQPSAEIESWRRQEIIPQYNRAGVTRFAYLMPPGATPPPMSTGGEGNEAGEDFDTRFFNNEQECMDWLRGA